MSAARRDAVRIAEALLLAAAVAGAIVESRRDVDAGTKAVHILVLLVFLAELVFEAEWPEDADDRDQAARKNPWLAKPAHARHGTDGDDAAGGAREEQWGHRGSVGDSEHADEHGGTTRGNQSISTRCERGGEVQDEVEGDSDGDCENGDDPFGGDPDQDSLLAWRAVVGMPR